MENRNFQKLSVIFLSSSMKQQTYEMFCQDLQVKTD